MRNDRELEAVQTVGPPGIYDACRLSMQMFRSLQRFQGAHWAGFSAILGGRKRILPACH